ncbi:hypothetical protein AZ002_000792 [Citrobacter freundii]|jgi:hypothetical protein|uniref:Uncharacterized protein n=1 Tax=Enterobacter cloacae subsp. cloacae (strain ATCC 13047 / DSM 30054 / NBRC 13535 / NCTC 10005 / WDCM 00083 / NCDC 279-56) TaxID=716541 RepID=A0A0H3CFN9_ENTCC|nr:hypothetical protein ECL_00504 [Enterobacter cloacae subsp. cloacae ATCC 13047]KZR19982.1 hypothetical protein A3N67_06605 [Enterobacter hormaechei subsp. steigerwaltii]OOC76866.1 hypothetical protein BWP06_27250 [Enterobacter cloacae]OUE63876.1 hypothetical protein AZ002_000792 [Citrobacter freundii]
MKMIFMWLRNAMVYRQGYRLEKSPLVALYFATEKIQMS